MKFILTFTVPPQTKDAAMARFLETGGQPPPGVTLLGRWTQLDLRAGFVLVDSEDAKALAAFAREWSDVVELTMTPVLEDQGLSDVLRRAAHPSVSAQTDLEDAPVAPETESGQTRPPYEEIA